ncbi:hypothetical protein CAPTEDRAFT_182432 [Capitella teleta]|uniref:NOL1/NOP2/Sun domain family member 4 n=1 Tax=Capitella teleta TaxID=283909 RepID=R7VBZ6_CAPTE|nr:hypothetical protein CAPTEDRAFT_182432 [Capitella teleta]|eukprot:ELU16149.1 hypothetical protein CAPTEDRAFT_182432 [Capitella teleta]
MRAALLTDSKYGALLNNFSLQKESIASDLQSAGALDMLELREQSVYEPSALDVHVVSEQAMKFPKHLQMYTYEKGNISTFKPTKPDASKRLGYYLMDAASLLPVLALDLQPHCSVLDMCAAPGGKSLAIMQSLLPSRLVCVDHSYARISRLKSVLRNYLPADDSLQLGGCPQVVHLDANIYCAKSDPQDVFDRVLVDVPCFADRHALYDETNMFQPKRMPERLNIQNLQRKLLFNGILKCRPGGTIVYSTCTLSPPQNDGVIQATIEKLSTETDAQVVIQNTTPIAQSFSETFVFHKCRFGHLVIPNLTANFGPTYFCQLKRTK